MRTERNSVSEISSSATREVREEKQAEQSIGPAREKASQKLKVAYIMSRFPRITETFVLYEMLAVEQQGVEVEVYPLQRESTQVIHREAVPYVARAHFLPLLSWAIVQAQLHFLVRKPPLYIGILWALIRANWGSSRYLLGALAFFPKAVHVARLIQIGSISHVHAHFASHPAVVAYVIHRLTATPYSFTAHGSDLHRDQHMLREKVEMAAFIVPISEHNKEIIDATCNGQYSDKTIVIHCGVDSQFFQPRSTPTPYERGAGPFSILCIGTMHEVKGQTYLIEACRLLRERGLEFVCHFVGDGPDLAMLQKLVTGAGLTEQFHFHGLLTRNEIAALLRGADVMVTPSVPSSDGRREGVPVVLMEGMASEVPVVASNLSGIPELVEDEQCGLLVQPRDVQGLAAALERLYADSGLRRRLGKAGREKVLCEFDLTRNAARLADLFRLCAVDLGQVPPREWIESEL